MGGSGEDKNARQPSSHILNWIDNLASLYAISPESFIPSASVSSCHYSNRMRPKPALIQRLKKTDRARLTDGMYTSKGLPVANS